MRVSLNWLKDYVDVELKPQDLAHLLTMSGLEVEGLEPLGRSLEGIAVAEILAVKPHPNADRLYICEVDTGREHVPVVCGAPNARAGVLAPLAPPGTRLPGGMVIKESMIRGERSVGMLLAEDEMGLTDDHSGIMILPAGLKPGEAVIAAMSLEDLVFDISITPNRPDCTSVMGVAREVAALTGSEVRRPETRIEEGGTPIASLADVTLDDPDGCPRYAAGMIRGVALKPSPFWLRYRLHASGVRSINNVVDVTNYVMLEMGQPLHAFDHDRLREGRIVVRRSKKGERFTTLDGQTRTLDGEVLLICDGQRPVALAGIMGGLNSEIHEGSGTVLLESACFDPITIRRGAKMLGLATEASYRFERGTDIGGVTEALARAVGLIGRLAGGEILQGVIDRYPNPSPAPVIELRVDRTNGFLGTAISREKMTAYLRALKMEVRELDENRLRVSPPFFRVDISREVDLMEEVARLEGYDRIPVTSPPIRASGERDRPELALRESAREVLVGMGFNEIISYSFISPDCAELLGAGEDSPLRACVGLLKPLSVEQSVMRTSLVPGLLGAVRTNISHGEENLRIFEWGRVFFRKDGEELPLERASLAACITGWYAPKTWYRQATPVDFYHIKGALECLLKSLGLKGFRFKKDGSWPGYHPDESAAVHFSDSTIGRVGRMAPEVLERYDVKAEQAYLFELDMDAVLVKMPGTRRFQSFARYPAVLRDLSIVVGKGLESARVHDMILKAGGALIESASLFDLYTGDRISPSEKVLSFRICYRSKDRTLDGKEINQLHQEIIDKVIQETGGRLREG